VTRLNQGKNEGKNAKGFHKNGPPRRGLEKTTKLRENKHRPLRCGQKEDRCILSRGQEERKEDRGSSRINGGGGMSPLRRVLVGERLLSISWRNVWVVQRKKSPNRLAWWTKTWRGGGGGGPAEGSRNESSSRSAASHQGKKKKHRANKGDSQKRGGGRLKKHVAPERNQERRTSYRTFKVELSRGHLWRFQKDAAIKTGRGPWGPSGRQGEILGTGSPTRPQLNKGDFSFAQKGKYATLDRRAFADKKCPRRERLLGRNRFVRKERERRACSHGDKKERRQALA